LKTAGGDLGLLTFTSSRSGCATGLQRTKQTSELANQHRTAAKEHKTHHFWLLSFGAAGAASLLLLLFTRAACFGLWACLLPAVCLHLLARTQGLAKPRRVLHRRIRLFQSVHSIARFNSTGSPTCVAAPAKTSVCPCSIVIPTALLSRSVMLLSTILLS
jgi:hypothetical protein